MGGGTRLGRTPRVRGAVGRHFAGGEGGGFGPAVEVDVPLAAVSIVAGYRALLKVVSDLPAHRHADKLRWLEDPGRREGRWWGQSMCDGGVS